MDQPSTALDRFFQRHPGLPAVTVILFVASIISLNVRACDPDEPEDDEGTAVLCDYLCIPIEDSTYSRCEWTCEDPEMEVACQKCAYVIRSGTATFECVGCDVGTY